MGSIKATAPVKRQWRRLRIPLYLVVARYFLYVLVGALVAVSIPWSVFTWQMHAGMILPANYAESHLMKVKTDLATRETFDAKQIPVAYRYTLWDAHGNLVASDMDTQQQEIARDLVFPARKEPSATISQAGGYFVPLSLAKGNKCVLSYHLMPQWADKNLRDTLPNPQDLMIFTVLGAVVAVVALTAWRASLVLGKKMRPLTEAAQAVGRQDFTQSVPQSNVIEINQVLRAIEAMRDSLHLSLASQRETERHSREQVAALAHDLKTPLTVVLGNLELLAEDTAAGKLGAEQAQCLQAARDSASTISEFVNIIVETTLGQARGFEMQPIALGTWLDQVESQARSLGEMCGVTLEVSRSPALTKLLAADADTPPLQFKGDALALQRAVLNLVDNACEHSRRQQVGLKFSVSSEDSSLGICVEDDGVGFSALALQRGCERFFRDDCSRGATRGAKHFGLGLAVASDVVQAHGGTITLSNWEDRPGHIGGACVKLSLPLMKARETQAARGARIEGQNRALAGKYPRKNLISR